MNHFINTKIKAVRLLSIVPTISVLIFSATYINRVYAVKKKNNKAVQQKEISKKHSLKLLSKNNVDNIAESNKSSVTEAVVQISSSGEIALNQTISQKPTENPNPTNNQ
ncbi:MAG: hypothetical protein PUC86_00925, partial [Solobacterium sp.]|nr:hypothetical protein [Solobacterium sp.]